MATVTLGTSATTSLTALAFSAGANMLDADVATISQLIKDDLLGFGLTGKPARNVPGAYSRNGQLFIPNRGVLQIRPGDYIAIDPNSGWPILISGNVIGLSGTPWVHT